MEPTPPPRVSAVSYLNTCPLIWGFTRGPLEKVFDLRFELPAACARSVESGEVAICLVPAVEVFRQGFEIVADVGIASDGPVRSIYLLHKKPLREIKSIAMDAGSRTSAALIRIVLAERYGVRPRTQYAPPNPSAMLAKADAALLIGDSALRLDLLGDTAVLDLGAEWRELTGLPMVYAVWAGRPGRPLPGVCALFQQSYAYGRARIEEIIASEAVKRGVPTERAREYLTHAIRYELAAREMEGFRAFERLAKRHGLV